MRIANRIIAVAFALALLFASLVATIEVVLAGIGRGPWILPYDDWYTATRRNGWDSSSSRWLFIACTVVGVVLLALQITRRPPTTLPMQSDQARAEVSRRSVEQALVRAARCIGGVASARAHIRGQTARLVVSTSRRVAPDLRPRVVAAANNELASLHIVQSPKVTVTIHRRNGR